MKKSKTKKYYHVSKQYIPKGFTQLKKVYHDVTVDGGIYPGKRTSVASDVVGCINGIIDWGDVERDRINGVRFNYFYLYEAIVPDDAVVIPAEEVYKKGYVCAAKLSGEAFILADVEMKYVGYVKYGTSVKNRKPILIEAWNTGEFDKGLSVTNVSVKYKHPKHAKTKELVRNTYFEYIEDETRKVKSTRLIPTGKYYGVKLPYNEDLLYFVKVGQSVDGLISAIRGISELEYDYLSKIKIELDLYQLEIIHPLKITNYTVYEYDLGIFVIEMSKYKGKLTIEEKPSYKLHTKFKPKHRRLNRDVFLYRSLIIY